MSKPVDAQQVWDQHRAVQVNGNTHCHRCGTTWPCPEVRAVLPVLDADGFFGQ